MTAELRSKLRQSLRAARRSLSPRQQRQAAARLLRAGLRQLIFHKARRIAFYLPVDGEIDPGLLLAHALRNGKHCYLPVLGRGANPQMMFVRFNPGEHLTANRWGIREPHLRSTNRIAPWALDLVFVPLTGFDDACNRLGMGKGFYDRAFRFKRKGHCRQGSQRRSPRLIGLAHECQKQNALPVAGWDIAMDWIFSDCAVYQRT